MLKVANMPSSTPMTLSVGSASVPVQHQSALSPAPAACCLGANKELQKVEKFVGVSRVVLGWETIEEDRAVEEIVEGASGPFGECPLSPGQPPAASQYLLDAVIGSKIRIVQ